MRISLAIVCLAICHAAFSQQVDTGFSAYEQTVPGFALKFKMVPIKGGSFTMAVLLMNREEILTKELRRSLLFHLSGWELMKLPMMNTIVFLLTNHFPRMIMQMLSPGPALPILISH